ncbi:TetR/AcrR family transcriptional regulator [Profundibacter sp.]
MNKPTELVTKAQRAAPSGMSKRVFNTRVKILNAARLRLTSRGFEKTTTADIARSSGVSEGTVFQHFGTKMGLLGAVMDQYYERLISESAQIIETTANPQECLSRLLTHYALQLEEHWDLIRVFNQFGRYGRDTFVTRFNDHNRAYTALYLTQFRAMQVDGIIRADIRAEFSRDLLLGGLEHYAIGHFSRDRVHDTKAHVAQLIQVFLEGNAVGSGFGS